MFLGFQRAHGFWALMVGATVSLMLAGSTALMLFVLLKWLLVGRPPSHTIHVERQGYSVNLGLQDAFEIFLKGLQNGNTCWCT